MTILTNVAGGQVDGTTATIANSGGTAGNAFQVKLSNSVGNTITFQTSAALGSCYRFTQPAAGSGSGGWAWSGFSSTHFAFRWSFEFPPGPYPANASQLISAFLTSTANTANLIGQIGFSGSGKMTLTNAANVVIWTATNAFPTTGRIDIAIVAVPGTTTSNGTLKAAYWTAATGYSGAPAEQSPNSSTSAYGAVNANVGTITYAQFGKPSNSTWVNDFNATNLYLDTANTTDALPPVFTAPTNTPPTIGALATQIGTAGTAKTFTAIATDTDGTIASYSWSVTAYDSAPYTITGGLSASTLTITPGVHPVTGAGARYDVTVVAYDDDGAPSSPATGKLLVRGTKIRPILETSNAGGWQAAGLTNSTGNRVASQVDGLTSTGVQAPTAPSAPAESRYRLAPLVASSSVSITLQHQLSAAAAGVASVAAYEGSAQRATWALASIQPPTTTNQTVTLTESNTTTGSWGAVVSSDELDLAYTWGP